jgi:hypothetical protein
MSDWIISTSSKKPGDKLSIGELACALYEGMPQLSNLAEGLARNYGKAEALTFFDMMSSDVRNFYYGIAKQLIDHASQWEKNEGSCCVLSKSERERLRNLPRVMDENSEE